MVTMAMAHWVVPTPSVWLVPPSLRPSLGDAPPPPAPSPGGSRMRWRRGAENVGKNGGRNRGHWKP